MARHAYTGATIARHRRVKPQERAWRHFTQWGWFLILVAALAAGATLYVLWALAEDHARRDPPSWGAQIAVEPRISI